MQLGVISDVHANLPALEAVLEDMSDEDALICLDDVGGYSVFLPVALNWFERSATLSYRRSTTEKSKTWSSTEVTKVLMPGKTS